MGLLLPAGVAVAALDFSGSGLSDGAHVSLGAREAEDLADLVEFLASERGPRCRIAIWPEGPPNPMQPIFSQSRRASPKRGGFMRREEVPQWDRELRETYDGFPREWDVPRR